jgi:hypothetical protein
MTASGATTPGLIRAAILLAILVSWLLVQAAAAGVHEVKSLAEAKQLAAQKNSLIIVDSFGKT